APSQAQAAVPDLPADAHQLRRDQRRRRPHCPGQLHCRLARQRQRRTEAADERWRDQQDPAGDPGLNVGNIVIGKLFGDKTVQINCAASDLTAKNGLFDTRLFLFDTDDAVINVTGTVDMSTEKLDLDVQPHTKGVRIFSLRSPLYVKGTLKHPDAGVQKGPLLLRGAGAVALGVVAAPAAALLALVAPSHDKDNDNTCRAVLQQLRSSGKMMPTKPKSP